jgi:hypothetical protein
MILVQEKRNGESQGDERPASLQQAKRPPLLSLKSTQTGTVRLLQKKAGFKPSLLPCCGGRNRECLGTPQLHFETVRLRILSGKLALVFQGTFLSTLQMGRLRLSHDFLADPIYVQP